MKQCLFCKTVYLDEFDQCPNCARSSHKVFEDATKQTKDSEQNTEQQIEQQEQIDLTKIPKIKNPNLFFIFGGILVIFLILTILCSII